MAFRFPHAGLSLTLLLLTLPARAQSFGPERPEWTTPIAPFRIADNLYYVGSKDLASYLVVTPAGDILINSSYERTVPFVRDSVEKLGFHFTDIKILLGSHAHPDHQEADAMFKQLTGATVEVERAAKWTPN